MSPNELDDLLRKKEAEFDVPFREEYWEKAQELLQRERRYRPAAFWNARTLGLAGAITLLSGMAVWYLLSTNPVSNTANNDTVAKTTVEPTPYFESRDNDVASTTNNVNVSAAENTNDENATVATSAITVTNVASSNHNNSPLHNNENSTTASTNTVVNSSSNRRSDNAAGSNNNVSRSSVRSTKLSDVTSSDEMVRGELFALRALSHNRISYRQDNVIPVFENMTPNDPALLKFYGLYYNSVAAPSRKIREFKHGAQYPQITWAAAAGVSVFNHLKEHTDSLSYIATNPYLGVKFGYQWNPKWSLCVQPTLVQRGGVRLYDHFDTASFVPSGKVTAYRHLYYMQVPVMVGVNISKSHNFSFGGGASVLMTTGSRLQNVETQQVEGSYKLKQSDTFKRLDYFAAVGYQFRMNKKIGFQASFRYGLTDVTKNTGSALDRDHHNVQTSIGMTYQFYQEKLQLH